MDTHAAAAASSTHFDTSKITAPGPFAISFSVPIPEPARAVSTRPSLPYPAYFDTFEGAAHAGAQPHFFAPCAFYKDRPGVNFEKVSPAYVQTKVRESFNAWKKDRPEREALYLTVIKRDGKDEGSMALASLLGIKAEPGVSVWVLKGEVAAPPATEEQTTKGKKGAKPAQEEQFAA